MINVVDGALYHVYAETDEEALQIVAEFFSSGEHDNDLIAIDGYKDEPLYASKSDYEKGLINDDCFVHFSHRMFKDARRNRHIINGGIVPALNELGDPVCLLKYTSAKSYFHIYENIKDAPDTRVFSFYDTVVLVDVTEYAFVLLREVLIDYNGRIICVGKDWPDFARLFPDRDNIEFIHSWDNFPPDVMNGRVMYLKEFTSIMAGYKERCAEGFFSYDEIMTLVYFFSIRKSYGEEHAEKKFYLVDPVFPMEGLMSICDKVQLPYAYALANGFIPVIRLTHSDSSMYSDFEGDDIWDKFFDQPLGKEADEWKNSKNVWEFPFATITFSTRWLMQKIVDCEDISLVNTFLINKHVQQSVEEARKTVLPNPERAIGVLLRGTDYTTTRLPGHSIMASPEQVMEIIKEFEATGNYNTIYLSTEDEDILQRMKELCGDRLRYIDQKRFRIQPGELLSNQTKERENDGWLKGKEYLTTLELLSECGAFIASGACCGTTCALNSGADHYKKSFVFDLGTN